jgi:hypothetical protein
MEMLEVGVLGENLGLDLHHDLVLSEQIVATDLKAPMARENLV